MKLKIYKENGPTYFSFTQKVAVIILIVCEKILFALFTIITH